MLKFISSSIESKCKSLKELSQDLIKGAILCNDDKALMYAKFFISELEKYKYNITSSLNYNKCIERISESFEVYNGFLDKDQSVKNEKTPSFLDIFCGAGGMSEGFTQATFNCDFACDLDGTAAETFFLTPKKCRPIRTQGNRKPIPRRNSDNVIQSDRKCTTFVPGLALIP